MTSIVVKFFTLNLSIAEYLGWLGTFSYVSSYALLALNRISADKITYHLLNVLGAVGLVINALHFKDNTNILVNAVWFIIGTAAIINIARRTYQR
ncbi:hypothetical protein [Chitinophaga sp.]|uniref:CBU_0592 family membrane protein n=1 Tax=Chitinophaga sp. TaxID=1869181 RepID=UPI0031D20B1C